MTDSIDRLVRKEVSLGAIRERPYPMGHIGLNQICPFLDVATDDVIFEYIQNGLQDGLAPARAEDSEAELAQKDEFFIGTGRAAVIDWSLKDKYTASDVSRYREDLFIRDTLNGVLAGSVPLNFTGRTTDDFESRLARDDASRRRRLDNRLEWLIMQAVETGGIVYNDGKIKFTVNYGRPAGQQDQAPKSGQWIPASNPNFDPIGDIIAMQQSMYNTYGVRPRRCITSQRVLNLVWQSSLWQAKLGLVVGGTPSSPINPLYTMPGFGPDVAVEQLSAATGVEFIIYDSVYQTRPVGSQIVTNNRFLSENKMYFLPADGQLNVTSPLPGDSGLGEIDDTQIGFAKMLTSPHPEGQWSSGYYEWEDESKDPWMHVRGSGIKAFPVFPYMEYTYTMQMY